MHRNGPVRLAATTVCHCSTVSSSIRMAGGVAAGVVEEHVEASERRPGGLEQAPDRRGIADIGGRPPARAPGLRPIPAAPLRAAPCGARPARPRSPAAGAPIATPLPIPEPAPVTMATLSGLVTRGTVTCPAHERTRHRRRRISRHPRHQGASRQHRRRTARVPHRRRRHRPRARSPIRASTREPATSPTRRSSAPSSSPTSTWSFTWRPS